jgi:7,8-dihydroneopterin aldolase/epimerase/oxygenase
MPFMDARLTNQIVGYALRLRGIRVQSRVGVSDSERALAQELVVAIDIDLPGRACPMADELEHAADYAGIVAVTDETARERDYQLLETFAFRVASRLGRRFPLAERTRVAVTKASVPVTPHTDEATVEITLANGFG